MNRLIRKLLVFGLGERDSTVYQSELNELFLKKADAQGKAFAKRWRLKEALKVGVHASTLRFLRALKPGREPDPAGRRPDGVRASYSGLSGDLRAGLRVLRRKPRFSALVVGTLGLGIGSSTILFSLVDGVLLKDLPYPNPTELVKIWKTLPAWEGDEALGEHWDRVGPTWSDFLTMRTESRTLQAISVLRSRTMIFSGVGSPERLEAGEVSAGLFSMLGIRPRLGRGFLPGEEGPGAPRLVVLSHSFWVSRFGSDPLVLGETVRLDGESFEVIGVLPSGFRQRSSALTRAEGVLDAGTRAMWIPIGSAGLEEGWSLEATGRLRSTGTLDEARRELEGLLRGDRSSTEAGVRLVRAKEEIVGTQRPTILLLFSASGILLLIACANVGALLMGESEGRRREMATRVALGAGGVRILRQLLIETLILGSFAGLLGMILAFVGVPFIHALAPPIPRLEEVALNRAALLFATLAGMGTGVLFGVFPALSLKHRALYSASRLGRRGSTRSGALARALVGAEIALTVVLLVVGGLFARSLMGLSQVDPGFDGSSVATVRAHLPITELRDPENIRARFTQILRRVSEIPGVVEVGAIEGLPFPGKATTTGIEIEGASAEQAIRISTENHLLLPGYLETMGVPLLAGRTLRDDDEGSEGPRSILINEQMAQQYWPGESPLGARIRQSRREYEVVGVVGNTRERHLADPPKATVYRTGPFFAQSLSLVARTRSDPEELFPALRGVIRELYPDVALSQETTMETLLRHSTSIERYRAMIVLFFGVFALFVASVGVFGVTAQSVAQRRQEMGIRAAVGAPAGALVVQVVKEVMKSGIVGVGLGCIIGLGATRLVVPFLFGVQSWDQATFLGAGLLLLSVCGGTAFLSSLSLFSVDPMIVLREE